MHGQTVGIGVTMLLHCDLVVAADSTRFSMPFVSLGLVPEAASSLLLPQRIGPQRAAELLLLGTPFDAPTAQSLGLVNRVVAEAAALGEARTLAAALAAQPPGGAACDTPPAARRSWPRPWRASMPRPISSARS